jgi:hypothetical protein
MRIVLLLIQFGKKTNLVFYADFLLQKILV